MLLSPGKFVELEFVTVGDDQLEERLRNSTEVEAEVRGRGGGEGLAPGRCACVCVGSPTCCAESCSVHGLTPALVPLCLPWVLPRRQPLNPLPWVLRPPLAAPLQLTAVELAALKQLNRGQTIYLMDQSGDMAKAGTHSCGAGWAGPCGG